MTSGLRATLCCKGVEGTSTAASKADRSKVGLVIKVDLPTILREACRGCAVTASWLLRAASHRLRELFHQELYVLLKGRCIWETERCEAVKVCSQSATIQVSSRSQALPEGSPKQKHTIRADVSYYVPKDAPRPSICTLTLSLTRILPSSAEC